MQDSTLTAKQHIALAALLGGATIEAAAQAAGVNAATVHRWLNLREFQNAQDEGRRHLAQLGLAQLQGLTATAVETVRSILDDRALPPAVRLRAAELVINSATKYLELVDLEQRISAIEGMGELAA